MGLAPGNKENLRVEIHECSFEILNPLTVHRVSAWEERDITTEGIACYIHKEDLKNSNKLTSGDICELMNPDTGFRLRIPVEQYKHKHYEPGTIRLPGIARKLLEVDSYDEGENHNVQLRVPPDQGKRRRSISDGLSDWIGRRFVDYSHTHLRVLSGYDRDEGRNIVRINKDAMEGLGIEENDRVLIQWGEEQRNVRCQSGWSEDERLEPKGTNGNSHGEEESLSVRIPSTERDKLNISIGDSIGIRRDMQYQAGKQVSLSVFGILGVIVGTNQLINMLFEQVDFLYLLISVSSIFVLSTLTVWFMLKPVRQKCRTPEIFD